MFIPLFFLITNRCRMCYVHLLFPCQISIEGMEFFESFKLISACCCCFCFLHCHHLDVGCHVKSIDKNQMNFVCDEKAYANFDAHHTHFNGHTGFLRAVHAKSSTNIWFQKTTVIELQLHLRVIYFSINFSH